MVDEQQQPGVDPILGDVQVSPRPLRWELNLVRAPGLTYIVMQVATEVGKFGYFFDVESARQVRDQLSKLIAEGSIEIASQMPPGVPRG